MNQAHILAGSVPPQAEDGRVKELQFRLSEVLGSLHELTKRRDSGELTLQESLLQELALVSEMGRLQDRLRLMGCHTYDGCPECWPEAHATR